jgi:hypothetical protein
MTRGAFAKTRAAASPGGAAARDGVFTLREASHVSYRLNNRLWF